MAVVPTGNRRQARVTNIIVLIHTLRYWVLFLGEAEPQLIARVVVLMIEQGVVGGASFFLCGGYPKVFCLTLRSSGGTF